MTAFEHSAQTARAHAPLVQRAVAIAATLEGGESIWLADAAETVRERRAMIRLERSEAVGIRREGQARFHLAYDDAHGETALGALIACMAAAAGPTMPIAADPESLSIFSLAERLAASEIPVLINGPTGTGKEVLSRFIHARSPRRHGPFVAVNCAAMPEAMLEALLFGHVKGAFTGATQASEGFFRAADGGTLLLDEIAEMPIALQAKLLRALQEGEVVPIGSTQPVKVDVRIIAAANRDLPTEVAENRFRADLYYRLNVFPLALRPLRERIDDIAPLAFAMVMRHGTTAGRALPWITGPALDLLRGHGWPGNVRELENVMRRALLLASVTNSQVIDAEHIRFDSVARLVTPQVVPAATQPAFAAPVNIESAAPAAAPGRRLAQAVQRTEAEAILGALEAHGGNRLAAARALGISERTLRYRLAAFREAGIPVSSGRGAAGGFIPAPAEPMRAGAVA